MLLTGCWKKLPKPSCHKVFPVNDGSFCMRKDVLFFLGDDEVSRVAAKGKSVLVHDVSDEYHENDDDSDGPPPGFERVRDFDDYAMDVDTRNDIDDEMGYGNYSD